MSDLGGYNPLRWKCQSQGCFNVKRRPKIEKFAAALPGKNAFTDVDAIVEIGGKALMLEWKSGRAEIPLGQSIMYRRLTKGDIDVLCIAGDAETMEITHHCWVREGQQEEWTPSSFDTVFQLIKEWGCSRNSGKPTPAK